MSGYGARHRAMVQEWKDAGHPDAPCSGHTYPLPACPAPEVHSRLQPGALRRQCPVDASCAPLTGWEAFLAHIHDEHTEGTEPERQMAMQAILERRPVRRPATVVPKVTADPRTAALWFLIEGDPRSAREAVGSMGTSERRAYLAQLTELVNMLWGELG